jgi:hypothetical protein
MSRGKLRLKPILIIQNSESILNHVSPPFSFIFHPFRLDLASDLLVIFENHLTNLAGFVTMLSLSGTITIIEILTKKGLPK